MNENYNATRLQVLKTRLHTHVFPFHQHDSWEILYYIENSGELRIENSDGIPFVPGTVICVPPNVAHGSQAIDGDFTNISIVDPEFPLAHLSDGGCIVTSDSFSRDLFQLFTLIRRVHTSFLGAQNLTKRDERIRRILMCIYDIVEEQLAHPTQNTDAVELVKGCLQDRYMDSTFTATAALRGSGYSQNYMRGQFLEQCGMTPAQYLTELRLESARELLEAYAPSIPISEVAHRSGFADQLYFSKVFRKRYGVSPSQYISIKKENSQQ